MNLDSSTEKEYRYHADGMLRQATQQFKVYSQINAPTHHPSPQSTSHNFQSEILNSFWPLLAFLIPSPLPPPICLMAPIKFPITDTHAWSLTYVVYDNDCLLLSMRISGLWWATPVTAPFFFMPDAILSFCPPIHWPTFGS